MAKKYIDAGSAKSVIKKVCETYNIAFENGHGGFGDMLVKAIDDMPAADVQEVRHGKWIDTEPKYDYENHCAAHYQCSECGRRTGIKQTRTYKYCPRCGARMDGEENG